MSSIIEVNDVTKFYRLGQISTGAIKDDLSRWWSKVRGKEDPLLKIGQYEANDEKTHWALKGVSFKIEPGEVLGIIGKNGAGKSTLLKILSRVTAPTTGHIKIHGRIASLLEVGTGFHPDLSGRENVYQNGAILGMKRSEIKSKFDEIVDFSGVARFIDTPVKRYSSGMYVRLAFAVAAHLEPEILIIDEVLAVGDAEFQKKCLGKMKAVSVGEGRTVLFVSHNLTAIQSLCNTAILLTDGKLHSQGSPSKVINNYLNIFSRGTPNKSWDTDGPGNENLSFRHVKIMPEGHLTIENEVMLDFSFHCYLPDGQINISLHLYTRRGDLVFASASPQQNAYIGLMHFQCIIPGNFLNDETYVASIMVVHEGKAIFFFEEAIIFEINDLPRDTAWLDKWPGLIRPALNWKFFNSNAGH